MFVTSMNQTVTVSEASAVMWGVRNHEWFKWLLETKEYWCSNV